MHTVLFAIAIAAVTGSDPGSAEPAPASAPPSHAAHAPHAAPEGATTKESGAWVLRVAGELEAELTEREGPEGPLYEAGRVATDTKLPVGYPAPTPPGAIELKHYPSIRRAEFTSEQAAGLMGQRGFWPLFQHIQRNDIAMTAPVEMEYADTDKDAKADQWTMAFLYHVPENGPTGRDGDDQRVVIIDTEPKTFLSLGVRGTQGWTGVLTLAERLDAWLAEHPEWRRTGMPRTLGYNGPNVRMTDQWWEVQIPVERVTPNKDAAAETPAASSSTVEPTAP